MSETKLQIIFENKEMEKCAICLELIDECNKCFTNTCRHCFCYQCLNEWSKAYNYCPLCRQLFSVMIWINHLRYKNDFELRFVVNNQTVYRQLTLNSRRDQLRQRLVTERSRRVQILATLEVQIEKQEQITAELERNIIKIDTNESQTNGIFEQILNEVEADTQLYTIDELDHSRTESVTTFSDVLTTYSSDGTIRSSLNSQVWSLSERSIANQQSITSTYFGENTELGIE